MTRLWMALPLGALLSCTPARAEPRVFPERAPWGADYLTFANAPEFLPRTYVYLSSKTGDRDHREWILFGAEYALHLPFINTLRLVALRGSESDPTPYVDEKRDNFAYAVTAFFRGDLRMYDRPSKPVVMPSYKPGISLQGFWLRKPPSTDVQHERRWLSGVRFEAYHYSNGQDRCTWDPALPDVPQEGEPPSCAQLFASLRDPQDQLNRSSGEFSTNRFLLALDTKYFGLDPNGFALWSLSAGVTGESNRPNGPGGIEDNYRDVYGWGSIEMHAEAERWVLRNLLVRLRGSYTHAIDDGPRIRSASGLAELSLFPKRIGRFGLFARYHGGRDFYNAFFVDSIQTFAGGLVWDDAPPLKFETAMER
jgi:hypothetical protein